MSEIKKLESLTHEQEAKLPLYRDMWVRIGLQTGVKLPDMDTLRILFANVYAAGDLPPPETIYTFRSPMEGLMAAATLVVTGAPTLVGEASAELKEKIKKEARGLTNNIAFGLHDAGWLSFYNYFLCEHPEIEGPSQLLPLMELAKRGIGWWIPFEKAVVVTEAPAFIHMRNDRLHNADGPALGYSDGYSVYALNGVRFSGGMERFITTPRDALNPKEILSIKNVEQRAEVIKRIGIDVLFDRLDTKLLDSNEVYRLHSVNLGAYRPRIYLEMINPSVEGKVHIEAVHPECTTIESALNFRNFGRVEGNFTPPVQLT